MGNATRKDEWERSGRPPIEGRLEATEAFVVHGEQPLHLELRWHQFIEDDSAERAGQLHFLLSALALALAPVVREAASG